MDKSAIGDHKVLFVGLGIIVIIFLGLILFGQSTPIPKNSPSVTGSSPASASLVAKVTSVPTTVYDTVGVGTADAIPKTISAPALSQNGKPEVFYEGAEYCPYCAAERWAMVESLSRFGTIANLGITHSSATDVDPDTPSFSFYNSTYTSQYISFVAVEQYTNIPNSLGYTTLQTLTSSQQALVSKYDATPYLPSAEADSIPFIDFGGKYLTAGASYSPTVLQNKSTTQIAAALNNPNNAIAQGVDGAANTLTASICKMTKNQPGNVCDSTIQKIESLL